MTRYQIRRRLEPRAQSDRSGEHGLRRAITAKIAACAPEATKTERCTTWRLVHSGEGDVRAFFDELEERVADGIDVDFQRLIDASSPVETTTGSSDLSPKQETHCRSLSNTDTTRVRDRPSSHRPQAND